MEYFLNRKNYETIADQIESDQSSRFLGKRNRNIIIIVNDDAEVLNSHRWMTLGQIKQLMRFDNLVNLDTRTALSCIPFSMIVGWEGYRLMVMAQLIRSRCGVGIDQVEWLEMA